MTKPTVVLSYTAQTHLADALVAAGLAVLAVPDIYDSPAGHAALRAIDSVRGHVVLVSEYYPRAARWMLAAKGIHRAAHNATAGAEAATQYVDVYGCSSPAEAARRVLDAAGAGGDGPPAASCLGGTGRLRDLRERLAPRWYPVIDYDRCANCLECAEFCLFGVYDVDAAGTAVVANADKCKPGCPACSRVCPAGAIIFPRYHGRGPIAGAAEGRPEQLDDEAARQAAKADMAAYTAGAPANRPWVWACPPRPQRPPAPAPRRRWNPSSTNWNRSTRSGTVPPRRFCRGAGVNS